MFSLPQQNCSESFALKELPIWAVHLRTGNRRTFDAFDQYGATYIVILSAMIGSFVVAASIFMCYGFADRLEHVIGPSAMNVILRLFTFLLICIGVQIFWNGASALITSVLLNAR